MKAFINKIIDNTFIDGPGSRTAVFFQGCNMNCLYCHNPETQNQCVSCGICTEVCPAKAIKIINGKIQYSRNLCIQCDKCINSCPNFSSPKYFEISTDELYTLIKGNEDYLDGITLSGGECTLQADFIYEFFSKIKTNTKLSCFLDTNGLMDNSTIEKLSKVTDGFMFDLKSFDMKKHIELTGKDNKTIFENIKIASEKGLLYEIRTVLVEGYNDREEEIEQISNYVKELNDYTMYKFIPFRPNGVRTHLSNLKEFPKDKYDSLCKVSYNILKERVIKL